MAKPAKLRMGMVGGGEGAFIGAVHRTAAELDGDVELVCGAFSSDATKSRRSGELLYGLPAERSYADYAAMFREERRLDATECMQFVVIATPNHVHFPVAKAALASGFHVMCDKPVTRDLGEALELADLVKETGLLFGLTHNYTGYPMIKEARHLITHPGSIAWLRYQGSAVTTCTQWPCDTSSSTIRVIIEENGSRFSSLISCVMLA